VSGTESAADASNPGVTPVDPDVLLAQTLADRATLVQLCLYALDRARSDGVAERIERGLAGVGVFPLRPDGEPFDPTRHEAAGAVPTGDAGLAGLIAQTEVAGFTDHGRVLRVPVVTVYQQAES
jgi:molecular chaperone GrpE